METLTVPALTAAVVIAVGLLIITFIIVVIVYKLYQ